MKKTKKALIALILAAALAAGCLFGIPYLRENQQEPVKVYNFQMVGMTEFWGDTRESYGPVTTDKIQTVFLTDTQIVSEVFVEDGQQVKKGDLLMSYDTTLSELELEKKGLEIEKAEMDLQDAEDRLAQIGRMVPMGFPPPEPETKPTEPDFGYALGEPYHTFLGWGRNGGSEQYAFITWVRTDTVMGSKMFLDIGNRLEEFMETLEETTKPTEESTAPTEESTEPTEESSEPTGESTEPTEESSEPTGESTEPTEESSEPTGESTEPTEESSEPTDAPTDPVTEPPVETEAPVETQAETQEASVITGDETLIPMSDTLSDETDPPSETEEPAPTAPETKPEAPTEESQPSDDLTEPEKSTEPTDESSEPTEEATEPTGESTESTEEATEPTGESTEPTEPKDPPKPTKPPKPSKPTETITPYYTILKITQDNMSKGDVLFWVGVHIHADGSFTLFNATGIEDYTLPKEEAPETQPFIDYFGSGFTRTQIQEMKNEQLQKIRELELTLKMAQAEHRIMERELSDGSVYAEIDGTIVSVLTEEEAKLEQQPIIKLSGGGGYYVTANISELEMRNMKIGQEVTIKDWDSGGSCTGVVKSLGDIPASNMGYNGMENPNASSYPFTVFVDESADLRSGSFVGVQYSFDSSRNGVYLQKPFLRTEQGRSFVYVRGADGLLEERTVVTGKSLWGSYIEILEGLTAEDLVAFPYGKNVKPGAPTEEGDTSDLYGR